MLMMFLAATSSSRSDSIRLCFSAYIMLGGQLGSSGVKWGQLGSSVLNLKVESREDKWGKFWSKGF